MVVYNFKKIQVVPSSDELIDIVLTRTQRKTPTQVHPGFKIGRIRSFYMRKVKFTQQTCSEKLGQMIADFPRLDDIHPFYADLINTLYDRDHYKLALGQMNTCKHTIDNISRDFLKLLKYGESAYQCKQLKRAALGRMCSALKRQKASLGYLEEVRKHLSRLPSIDPSTRTLLVCGYPNVGKSSFINKITRANVEVQPYAFTTKSLYVGHMDYKYLRWQAIDTPGILDHPLAERNTIEMQAITALAHLQCSILFFIDVSEQCGYTIEQQVALFRSIKPLFAQKPLFVVANKIDQVKYEDVPLHDRELIEEAARETGAILHHMSNASDIGVSEVKMRACDKLLEQRVTGKVQGKKVDSVLNRLTVAYPKNYSSSPDDISTIPKSVLEAQSGSKPATKRKTQKEIQQESGGPGVYAPKYHEYYDLKNNEWKTDIIPEIMDGKNIADFIDPDIVEKLEALEREEAALEEADMDVESESEDEARTKLVKDIRRAKTLRIKENLGKKSSRAKVPRKALRRTVDDFANHLDSLGVESRHVSSGSKRRRSVSRGRERSISEVGDSRITRSKSRSGEESAAKRKRSMSRAEAGMKDEAQMNEARNIMKKKQARMNRMARAGEADRKAGPKLLRHLLEGKRRQGTTRSR